MGLEADFFVQFERLNTLYHHGNIDYGEYQQRWEELSARMQVALAAR